MPRRYSRVFAGALGRMYKLRFERYAEEELDEAIHYFTCQRRGATEEDFVDLIEEAFTLATAHPEALPLVPFPGRRNGYRRVVVWHFVFLYLVDHDAGYLIIDRVVHERSLKGL